MWSAVVLALLLMPSIPGPPLFALDDKLAHFGVFALFAVLAVPGAPLSVHRRGSPFWWAVITAASIGAATEILQGAGEAAWAIGRAPEVGDVVMDALGGLAGAAWATRQANKKNAAP